MAKSRKHNAPWTPADLKKMRALFAELPEACDNTLAIAERCEVSFTEGNFVSLAGTASIVRDVAKKRELWMELGIRTLGWWRTRAMAALAAPSGNWSIPSSRCSRALSASGSCRAWP